MFSFMVLGKALFACRSAVEDFQTILQTVGGPQERARATELLQQVTVVEDHVSETSQHLQLSLKIKERAKVKRSDMPP